MHILRRRYIETFGNSRVGISGHFSGCAIKNGVVTRSFGMPVPVPNLITDVGLDSFGTAPEFRRMLLGTGTTPPNFTDTALENFGVSVVNVAPSYTYGAAVSPPYYGYMRMVWTSAVGGATGTWTEIGIAPTTANSNLRSRALILDGGGNPTSFPVLSDEQFQGTYEFRIYSPTTDVPATIALSGNPYDTITRARAVTRGNGNPDGWAYELASQPFFASSSAGGSNIWYSGGLAATTASTPLGSSLNIGTLTVGRDAYGSGNYYQDSYFRWGSGGSNSNCQTLSAAFIGASLQVEYDPIVTKNTNQELIHWQRIEWARR